LLKIFSLGDNNFDDETAKYHTKQAVEAAKLLVGAKDNIAFFG